MSAARSSFLVGDWGTTSLRLWRLSPDGAVLAEARAPDGLTAVADRGFSAVLDRHLATLEARPGEPVVLCGMVGARTGWVEAGYLPAPLRLDGLAAGAIPVTDAGRPVFVLPGVSQDDPARPDVMRGEETQLLGLLLDGGEDTSALVCMPGTHSKWVRLEAGSLAGFSTAMTGEMFALLRRHSVLSGTLDPHGQADPASAAFRAGVSAALDAPASLLTELFAVRAGFLLHGASPADGLSRLSGLLLGSEIAGARARWGALGDVRLVASGAIAEAYRAALDLAGVAGVVTLDADALARAGLLLAARRIAAAEPSREVPA